MRAQRDSFPSRMPLAAAKWHNSFPVQASFGDGAALNRASPKPPPRRRAAHAEADSAPPRRRAAHRKARQNAEGPGSAPCTAARSGAFRIEATAGCYIPTPATFALMRAITSV